MKPQRYQYDTFWEGFQRGLYLAATNPGVLALCAGLATLAVSVIYQ